MSIQPALFAQYGVLFLCIFVINIVFMMKKFYEYAEKDKDKSDGERAFFQFMANAPIEVVEYVRFLAMGSVLILHMAFILLIYALSF